MKTDDPIRISIEEMLTEEMIRGIGADHEDAAVCVTRICGEFRRLHESYIHLQSAIRLPATVPVSYDELLRENIVMRHGFAEIRRKILEDCLLHEEHPIVKACEDTIAMFTPDKKS